MLKIGELLLKKYFLIYLCSLKNEEAMLFDPPIASGANTFIWIVVILIAFVGAISQHDALFKGKKKEEQDS